LKPSVILRPISFVIFGLVACTPVQKKTIDQADATDLSDLANLLVLRFDGMLTTDEACGLDKKEAYQVLRKLRPLFDDKKKSYVPELEDIEDCEKNCRCGLVVDWLKSKDKPFESAILKASKLTNRQRLLCNSNRTDLCKQDWIKELKKR